MNVGAPHLVTVAAPQDPRIRAAVEGDRAAAEALLGELLPRVRNLVRYLVRGDGDVDDIAQEALLAILRGLGTYRGEGAFTSWADRVVARTTFAYLRKVRKVSAMRAHGADLAAVPDRGQPPDLYASRRDAVKLLDELPYEQRHVLVLHHVVGMSVAEVAGEIGAPIETVRSRLRIGKQKLRAVDQRGAAGRRR